ncbi:MAG: hypothetical protein ACOYT4_01840 [Nanoarchaeota archaeon]
MAEDYFFNLSPEARIKRIKDRDLSKKTFIENNVHQILSNKGITDRDLTAKVLKAVNLTIDWNISLNTFSKDITYSPDIIVPSALSHLGLEIELNNKLTRLALDNSVSYLRGFGLNYRADKLREYIRNLN